MSALPTTTRSVLVYEPRPDARLILRLALAGRATRIVNAIEAAFESLPGSRGLVVAEDAERADDLIRAARARGISVFVLRRSYVAGATEIGDRELQLPASKDDVAEAIAAWLDRGPSRTMRRPVLSA